jgi:hypothetical protein
VKKVAENEMNSNAEKFRIIFRGEEKEFESPEEAAAWLMAHSI